MGASRARKKKRSVESTDITTTCGVAVKKSGLHHVTVCSSSGIAKKVASEPHRAAHLPKAVPIYNLEVQTSAELDGQFTVPERDGRTRSSLPSKPVRRI
eukprot:1190972-Prorocentrum_minimum.AAC.3